jgi:DNA-directed RNA polymerase subunit RPC12/RpoP
MKYRCAHCGKTADKPSGHVNRARENGMKLFCDRRCFGLDRRTEKTKAQRIAEKAASGCGMEAVGYEKNTSEAA